MKCEFCGGNIQHGNTYPGFCSEACWKAEQVRELGQQRSRKKLEYERSIQKKCDNCSLMFVPANPRQRFCSESCRKDAKRRKPSVKTCQVCGKQFTAKNIRARFCSDECRAIHSKNSLTEQTCPVCSVRFMPARALQKFCSDRCRDKNKTEVRRERNESTKFCWRCGKPAKAMSHYCSDRCYKLHEVARGAFSGDVSFWEENPGLSVTDFDISFRKKTKDGITYAEQQKAESVKKYARVEIPPEILKIKEERRRNEQRK